MFLFRKDQEIVVIVKEGKNTQVIEGTIISNTLGENKLLIKLERGKELQVDMDDVVSIDGLPRKKPVYYQPRLTDEEFMQNGIGSYEVFRNFENAKEDFPDHVIDRYEGSDIEDHAYIDDADGRSRTYYVDVPNPNKDGDEFTNIYTCFDKDEAILYARINYNADENGLISLISQS